MGRQLFVDDARGVCGADLSTLGSRGEVAESCHRLRNLVEIVGLESGLSFNVKYIADTFIFSSVPDSATD